MKVTYDYDQDPRYGWASIDLEGKKDGLIVIHTETGSLGFCYSESTQKVTPTCICHAYHRSECACTHLEPDYWSEEYSRDI